MMLREAISYPLQKENWYVEILIGGSLIALAIIAAFMDAAHNPESVYLSYIFSFVITIPLAGFYLRVVRTAALDTDTQPKFTNWERLLIDGGKVWATTILYLAPGTAIFLFGGYYESKPLMIGGILVVLGMLFLLPVGLTNLAIRNQLSSVVMIEEITDAAFTTRYAKSFVPWFVLVFIFGRFSIILYLAFLIGAFVEFYIYFVATYLIGSGCGPQLAAEIDERDAPNDAQVPMD